MKAWKAVAGVVLVFVLGVLSGGIGVYRFHRSALDRFARGEPARVPEFYVRKLSHRLDLDPAQRERVETIVRRTVGEVRQVREECRPRIDEALEKGRRDIRAELRPEQQRRFDELDAERHRHRGRGRGGMRGPGP